MVMNMGEVQEAAAHDDRSLAAESATVQRRKSEYGSQAIPLRNAVIQAKLTVGPAVDPYEVEADQVADRVVRHLATGVGPGSQTADPAPGHAVQRIQRRATIGTEGGSVDADTERAIQSSRGGGKGLPDGVRQSMEGAFGADFSGVRVHEGSQATDLSNRIQAKAFTVGNDVYFRDGLPSQSSTAGQHLLAHELTHTIQQGGGHVLEGPQRVMRATQRVQRRHQEALLKIRSYRMGEDNGATVARESHFIKPGTKLKKMSGGEQTVGGVKYVAIFTPSSFPRPPARARPGGGPPPPPPMYFVEASAIDQDFAGKESTSLEKGIEQIGNVDSVVKHAGIAGSVGRSKEKFGSSENLIKDAGMKDRLGHAGDSVKGVTSLLTMASSIMQIKNASGKNKVADRVEGSIKLAGSTATAGGAIASMVDRGGGLSDKLKASKIEAGTATADTHVLSDAGKASSGLAAFASVFSGIKATFDLVTKAMEVYKKNKQPGALSKRSTQEKFHEAMAIITSILEAAASGVSAAKGFLDAFSTGAGVGFSTAVPGFGIALGAAELIVRGVDAITASIHGRNMRQDKRAVKVTDWMAHPEFNPTVVGAVFPEGFESRGAKGKTHPIAKRFKELSKKRGRTSQEAAFVKWGEDFPPMHEYLTTKGVQSINKKRARRAALKIGVAMTKIAGDVATLGGASAPVGMGLKAGAALVDSGCTLFRKLKQAGRDKAAKSPAGSRWNSVFNAQKSTGSKLAEYNKQVDRIFAQIVAASKLSDRDSQQEALGRIDRVFSAIGVHPKRAWALAEDVSELREELITYMKKRE